MQTYRKKPPLRAIMIAELVLWPILFSVLVGLAYINPAMAITWMTASTVMTWLHRV